MDKGKVISFSDYHRPKVRAEKRAREIMGYLEDKTRLVLLPLGVDPYAEDFEKEIARVLYESDKARNALSGS